MGDKLEVREVKEREIRQPKGETGWECWKATVRNGSLTNLYMLSPTATLEEIERYIAFLRAVVRAMTETSV